MDAENSDTPKTNAAAYATLNVSWDGFSAPPKDTVSSDFARQLERELNEAKKELDNTIHLWKNDLSKNREHNDELRRQNERLREALEAVILFHSGSPWTDEKRNKWWNWAQNNEATTRVMCDRIRIGLGQLPSCFGNFVGRRPSDIPSDMRLSDEQRNSLDWIKHDKALASQPEEKTKCA